MNPGNPVVRLCAEGMQAEAEGRDGDARAAFEQAWEIAEDDYDACVAAHYVARHQTTPQETLRWNQERLDRADRVGDDRVKGFYASLHLNMAKAHADLGDPGRARRHYELAAAHVGEVPHGPYADWVRFAIAEGLRSAAGHGPRTGDALLRDLLAGFCARGDLKALGLVVPAYLADLGTEADRMRLLTALRMLHAAGALPGEEQGALSAAIGSLHDDAPATAPRA
ncbi:hypothetical protein [Microbispora catharanthi]|uniref:Tetratricopeptide repeat protein n=1 Tax=Microbispora catharanthi TaxID=1712871 RepID=A0A5N6BP41_9ACTN|nr:hypothetical protein [Microbispora catharanthi]KAB8181649.1 hypothetical protein FH610_027495 [Microbispora catharanthi]